MGRIRSKNTQPEILVRRVLHASGFRFRLHVSNLPGKPDIVLPKHAAVVLVQGCFWHGHVCRRSRIPKSNINYWRRKIDGNAVRDKKNIALLEDLGWHVFTIWECDLRSGLEMTLRALKPNLVCC